MDYVLAGNNAEVERPCHNVAAKCPQRFFNGLLSSLAVDSSSRRPLPVLSVNFPECRQAVLAEVSRAYRAPPQDAICRLHWLRKIHVVGSQIRLPPRI